MTTACVVYVTLIYFNDMLVTDVLLVCYTNKFQLSIVHIEEFKATMIQHILFNN